MTGKIEHFVVVMLENRSFDNLLGWLYAPSNTPAHNIPAKSPPTFDGLVTNKFWNETPGPNPKRIYATEGTTGSNPYIVPCPDPHELFDHMNMQLFGTKTPQDKQQATMSGFLADYTSCPKNKDPSQIMESYSPDQVRVLSTLAREFAVCDRWFGSAPCQTWPNRAFVHAGTSCGRVNNCDGNIDDCLPDPGHYDGTKTIFNVLEDTNHSWKVYNDTFLPSLTRVQFIKHLWDPLLDLHFCGFDDFQDDAKSGNLPQYSFIEPSFQIGPNDQHPAHNVLAGEKFLYDIWTAVSTSPKWESTLLLITYDEHGGCYDHVPPPWTATPPDDSPPQQPFGFNRYGTRVPAVLISPYISPGTVFRSPSQKVEFDHTSILATIRDWLSIPEKEMLASKRIKNAPTLFDILTLDKARSELPVIPKPLPIDDSQVSPDAPLNTVQKAVIKAAIERDQSLPEAQKKGIPEDFLDRVKTESEAEVNLRAYFGK